MLKNDLKIALRNLMRSKVFSLINVIGLAFGLTCSMLIGAFVYDEAGFDRASPNHANIYRVGLQLLRNGGLDDYPAVDVAVGAGMKNAFPEILASTRILRGPKNTVEYKGVQFKEDHMAWADSNFLKMMGIPLIEGNENTALTDPHSVVITSAVAKKYFGDKPALGEFLKFGNNELYKVTGIIAKVPDNTHFHFDLFLSTTTVPWIVNGQTWSNVGTYTYLQLYEKTDPHRLEVKFRSLIEKYVAPEMQHDMGSTLADAKKESETWKFYLMPLTDIHLRSATKYELEANGDIQYVYIFAALGIFIVLLAGINFTNLSTANSARRSKEVGIRKALGSVKEQLVRQFLTESIVLSLLAVGIALIFVFALLPFFNDLTGKHISILFFLTIKTLPALLAAGVAIGLLAGVYPAFFLSGFQTIRVLKGGGAERGHKGGLRNALVVFQFAISTTLIIATIVVYQQLHFMQNMKLGYSKDQILVIESAGGLGENERVFSQKLEEDHRVTGTSITRDAPVGDGNSFDGTEIHAKGIPGGDVHTTLFHVDYDYVETMGMKMVAGRNFSKDFPSDTSGVVINETAVRDLGWTMDNVLGNTIIRSGRKEFTIVGVVADFHYTSARQRIAPLLMLLRPLRWSGPLIVHFKTDDVKAFLNDLQKSWKSANANAPMDYYFLNEQFGRLYKAEETTEKIFVAFVSIAIVIACLGLYGLSSFSAEQRVKEVGIRKVMGSSVRQILVLLSKDFVLLVAISFVFAVPVSWYGMHKWLQSFSYRVEIGAWVFAVAGLIAVLIAILTVSYQAFRAAMVNPVTTLRAE